MEEDKTNTKMSYKKRNEIDRKWTGTEKEKKKERTRESKREKKREIKEIYC